MRSAIAPALCLSCNKWVCITPVALGKTKRNRSAGDLKCVVSLHRFLLPVPEILKMFCLRFSLVFLRCKPIFPHLESLFCLSSRIVVTIAYWVI